MDVSEFQAMDHFLRSQPVASQGSLSSPCVTGSVIYSAGIVTSASDRMTAFMLSGIVSHAWTRRIRSGSTKAPDGTTGISVRVSARG